MYRLALCAAALLACRPSPPEIPPIALTPVEYNNTIRDLLDMPASGANWPQAPALAEQLSPSTGQQAGLFGSAPIEVPPWPWEFPDEAGIDHFEGMADGQESTPYFVEELQKAAVFYGAHTLVSPSFFTCEDFGALGSAEQASCGWASVERFAQRAWRRPLTDEERTRLNAFWESQLPLGTVEEAIVLTAVGVLQSPSFVFRTEGTEQGDPAGDVLALNDWELASRLSYFLWDSMPDGALFAAAAQGELSKPKVLAEQARRMLQDPKARNTVVRFHEQWLETKGTLTISPARRAYGAVFGVSPTPPLDTTGDGVWPSLLGPIRHSMVAEMHLFIERTVFEGAGTFQALMTDNHGYLSDATAPIYGENVTPLDGDTVRWDYGTVIFSQGSQSSLTMRPVTFSENERAGLLTMPSVLAVGAYPVHPAPVQRGVRILERLACQSLGAPPPDAEAGAPPDVPDAESTNRVRTEASTSPANCAVCHENINPPGFAFEHYDSLGRYRSLDNELPVDASGFLTLQGGETFAFANGVELSQQLAQSHQVRSCYAKRWTQYALGLELEDDDVALTEIQERFLDNDNVQDLLVSIVTSDLFRFRRVGGAQ